MGTEFAQVWKNGFIQTPCDLACGHCKINARLSSIYLFLASLTWEGCILEGDVDTSYYKKQITCHFDC